MKDLKFTTAGEIMSQSTHQQMLDFFEAYKRENARFTENKVKSAAPKARKALQLLSKCIKSRRKEIMDEKKALNES